jgi:cytochrome c oxidase subunit 4
MSAATGHVVAPRVYWAIFLALLTLTATTTAAAFVDLGPANTIIMLAIAVTKATLVVLYFMHLRWSTRLTQLAVAAGVGWLGILIGFTLSDMLIRGAGP